MKFLIVTKTLINDSDGASLSLRNWLHEAFPARIAQIYSGAVTVGAQAFPAYMLGAADRRFGRIFSSLKRSAQRAEGTYEHENVEDSIRGTRWFLSSLIRRVGGFILSLGLWELVFKPKLSPELCRFVRHFAPDVIIAQGFDLGFTWLPVRIHDKFNVPIITINVDDWEPYLYRGTARMLGMQAVVKSAFAKLLKNSERRYCISPQMAREYKERYGLSFEVLMQVDRRPLLNFARARPLDRRHFVVAYSGSLGLKRWEGLRDLADALSILDEEGICGELRVYTPAMPADAASLRRHPKIRLLPHLQDEQVLSVLAQADIVYLPETFDKAIRGYIRLSVSTKAHIYMMTGSVPLVYGPPEIGTVRYAVEEGWGVVVDQPDLALLVNVLRSIIDSPELRRRKIEAARDAFNRNHSPASPGISSLLRTNLNV